MEPSANRQDPRIFNQWAAISHINRVAEVASSKLIGCYGDILQGFPGNDRHSGWSFNIYVTFVLASGNLT
jgi:hypothetical protein